MRTLPPSMAHPDGPSSAARQALQLIADGKLDLSVLISAKLPFTRYLEGIGILKRKEAIKICYQPWE